MNNETTILDQAATELSNLFNDNDAFNKELVKILHYYSYQFYQGIKGKPEREEFQYHFFDYIKEVIQNGYICGLELINHKETILKDEFLVQPNGILKEAIVEPMIQAAGDLEQSVSTTSTSTFEVWVLEKYPILETYLFQAKKDIALYGASLAFIHERDKRNIYIVPEDNEAETSMLYRSDDLLFVSPQWYLSCQYYNGISERWMIKESQSLASRNPLIGEIQINFANKKLLAKLAELPYTDIIHEQSEFASVHLTVLENKINRAQQLIIIEIILNQLYDRMSLSKEQVQIKINQSDAFYFYTNY